MPNPDLRYWLVKSEPFKYSWGDLVKDGWTYWDGVRNYEARNNIRSMAVGDQLLFYHSNEDRAVVGIAEVIREHYQDPTTDDDRWSVVDIKPLQALSSPVTLAEIKREPRLSNMQLVTRGRLSVSPVSADEFGVIVAMGGLD
ncbi:MAG: EVE domain-containing protein [Bryobacterales bacterium]|nr:EVE domain-containing protein [Bryobacterales bacterium]MDE0262442.1 EVE domain-containing protein [Bryobacterales bacterium]MDE0624209.1 EVE domain-containing protein [Bryobacterales bacterium]